MDQLDIHRQRKLQSKLTAYTNTNSKWITDKLKTQKIFLGNIRGKEIFGI